jgi:hypothetical protein
MAGLKGLVARPVNSGAGGSNPFFLKRKQGIPFRTAVDCIAALIEEECDKKSDQNQADKNREKDYVH